MVLAIEPMVNVGTHHVRMGQDNWAVYSQDGSLAAHFEHTVAITAEGPRILTPWHELVPERAVGSRFGLSCSASLAASSAKKQQPEAAPERGLDEFPRIPSRNSSNPWALAALYCCRSAAHEPREHHGNRPATLFGRRGAVSWAPRWSSFRYGPDFTEL